MPTGSSILNVETGREMAKKFKTVCREAKVKLLYLYKKSSPMFTNKLTTTIPLLPFCEKDLGMRIAQ